MNIEYLSLIAIAYLREVDQKAYYESRFPNLLMVKTNMLKLSFHIKYFYPSREKILKL